MALKIRLILKKILIFFFKYLRKENYEIKKIIYGFEIDLDILDVGATGGIQKKWGLIKKILNVSLVDANETSIFGNNEFKSLNIIPKLFSSVAGKKFSLILQSMRYALQFQSQILTTSTGIKEN